MDHKAIATQLKSLVNEIRQEERKSRLAVTKDVYWVPDRSPEEARLLKARIADWERRGTAIRQHIERELASIRRWDDPAPEVPSRYGSPRIVSRYGGVEVASRYAGPRSDRRRNRQQRARLDAAFLGPFLEFASLLTQFALDQTDQRGRKHSTFEAFKEAAEQIGGAVKAGESLTKMQQEMLLKTTEMIVRESPGAAQVKVNTGGYSPVLAYAIIGTALLNAGAGLLASVKSRLT